MNRIEDKKKEAIVELKEWINNPLSKENLTIYGKDTIKEKLAESFLPKSVINGFESLNNWFMNNFVYEMLTSEKTEYRGLMTANGYEIITLAHKFSAIYPNNPPYLLFDKSTYWLSNCLIAKWYNSSEELIGILNNALSTEMLDGGWEIKPTAWFILEVVNKGYKINNDLSYFNYPDDMGIYQEAIDDWDTGDLLKVDSIVSKLCDYHLENAHYGIEETTPDIQFGDSSWFVYAFEILAWLSIREKCGLENPKTFSHDLMQLEINKLPNMEIPIVKSELFEKAMNKLSV